MTKHTMIPVRYKHSDYVLHFCKQTAALDRIEIVKNGALEDVTDLLDDHTLEFLDRTYNNVEL